MKLGSRQLSGIAAIMIACVLSAAMGAAFYMAHLLDPNFSSLSGSFIRVSANVLFVFMFVVVGRDRTRVILPLTGHGSLWAWGIFGAITVTSYFAAIHLIGSGLTSFLSASSGIFTAVFSPILTKQRTAPIVWVGIAGAMLGFYFMSGAAMHGGSGLGACLALGSGLSCALAYLMIARTKGVYSSATILMTWCISAAAAHIIAFLFFHVIWPNGISAWVLLIVAGLAASASMHFSAFAFQQAPPALVASVGYMSPVLSLVVDVLIFGFKPSMQVGLGAFLILSFGTALPLLRLSRAGG